MQQFISLSTAIEMTSLYRSQRDAILKPEFQNNNVLSICETFERSVIDKILSHPDCTRLRIYYGMKEDLKVHAIVVAVNENDEDILPPAHRNGNEEEDEEMIAENAMQCPIVCPPESPLNT